jgi:hypothetical protein
VWEGVVVRADENGERPREKAKERLRGLADKGKEWLLGKK